MSEEWEYRIQSMPGLLRQKDWPAVTGELDELGRDGWEAVGFWGSVALLLKRRVSRPASSTVDPNSECR